MDVIDAAGDEVGELVDVITTLASSPVVCAFIFARGDTQLRVPWQQVREIDVDADRLLLTVAAGDLQPAAISGQEIALVDSVLDNQVLDVGRRRFVRVQDVRLEARDGDLVVAGIDASSGAAMRRMGLGFLARRWRQRPGDFVPWEDVNLISVRLSRANFVEAFAEIAELHPADLADVVGQVGPRERAAVLAALNAPLAADTLQEMDVELRNASLVEMPRLRAAAVMRHIDPDDAADALAELPEDVAEEILELLPVEAAAALRRLASHPEHSAGALMTTGFFALQEGVDAGQALEKIRSLQPDAGALVTVFVVTAGGRLAGQVTLAELVLAEQSRPVTELMDDDVVRVGVEADEDEVGRLMTKYDLLALPVVDDDGALLGMVTLDDALEAIVPEQWKQRIPRVFR